MTRSKETMSPEPPLGLPPVGSTAASQATPPPPEARVWARRTPGKNPQVRSKTDESRRPRP